MRAWNKSSSRQVAMGNVPSGAVSVHEGRKKEREGGTQAAN